jgi:hypothetical protein
MKEIKLRFELDDLAILDKQAAMAGVSRAELIRSRALVLNCDRGLSTTEYHRLVSDANTYLRGDMPRRLIELLVAFVVTWISSKSLSSKNLSSPDSMTP